MVYSEISRVVFADGRRVFLATLKDVVVFFDAIQLEYRFEQLASKTFLPGLMIQEGRLIIDPDKLTYPGDTLHEAGHIAVTPEAGRPALTGDVHKCGHDPGDEMAAIAWSWAALQAIGGPPEFLFHPDGYKRGSESYIEAFSSGHGFGYPLLAWYGMTEMPTEPGGFPSMKLWLRP